jgi:hypothetical protein
MEPVATAARMTVYEAQKRAWPAWPPPLPACEAA